MRAAGHARARLAPRAPHHPRPPRVHVHLHLHDVRGRSGHGACSVSAESDVRECRICHWVAWTWRSTRAAGAETGVRAAGHARARLAPRASHYPRPARVHVHLHVHDVRGRPWPRRVFGFRGFGSPRVSHLSLGRVDVDVDARGGRRPGAGSGTRARPPRASRFPPPPPTRASTSTATHAPAARAYASRQAERARGATTPIAQPYAGRGL